MARSTSNPLAEVAATVVANDDQLRQRVQKLVRKLVAEAEHTLEYGTVAERAALMKAVVPTMLRSIQTADADAGQRDMQDAYQRMLAEMRGGASADAGEVA